MQETSLSIIDMIVLTSEEPHLDTPQPDLANVANMVSRHVLNYEVMWPLQIKICCTTEIDYLFSHWNKSTHVWYTISITHFNSISLLLITSVLETVKLKSEVSGILQKRNPEKLFSGIFIIISRFFSCFFLSNAPGIE